MLLQSRALELTHSTSCKTPPYACSIFSVSTYRLYDETEGATGFIFPQKQPDVNTGACSSRVFTVQFQGDLNPVAKSVLPHKVFIF